MPNESVDWKISPSSGVTRVGSLASIDGSMRRKDHDTEELQLRFGDSREETNQRWPRSAQERQRTPSPAKRSAVAIGQSLTARERFQDAKEKFLSLERNEQERMLQIRNERRKAECSQNPVVPVFRPHVIRSLSHSKTDEETDERLKASYSSHDEHAHKYMEEMRYQQSLHAHNTRNSHFSDGPDFKRLSYSSERDNLEDRTDELPPGSRSRHQYVSDHLHPTNNHRHRRDKGFESEKNKYDNAHRNLSQMPTSGDVSEDPGSRSKRQPRYFQEEETPVPRQRYLSPDRVRPDNQERIRATSKHRTRPGLYPSRSSEDIDDGKETGGGHLDGQHYTRQQSDHRGERKRRSLYESVQEERKRNSNELAKEFMKRSLQDPRSAYKDLKEQEHFSHSERELNRLPEDISARYRHSYVEPVSRSHHHLPRASSAVSPQRVGIAAIHPY